MNDRVLVNSYARCTFFTVPPTLRDEPGKARQKKEEANANRHNPRRDLKSIQQLAGDVVRCCHSQSQQCQLGGEHTSAKAIDDCSLQYHGRKHPQNTAAAVRDSQHDEGKDETCCAAKCYVKDAADQKRDPNRCLHAPVAFTCNSPRHNWADGRSDATRCEENTDAAGGIFANREYTFAEHCQQRQYAATESPCWLHEQRCEDARPVLNVLDALDRLCYSQQPAERHFLSFTFFPFRNANTRNQHRREQVGH